MEHQDNEIERYCYTIRIADHLDKSWAAWLDCANIIHEIPDENQMPVTVLTCFFSDQPALRGLLNKLFDLNLTLLSVVRCRPDTDTDKP